MRKLCATLVSASICLSLSAPVRASDDSDKAAAAALAILGIAALAHHSDHYRDGYRPNGGEETADFERGYRDGLHNEPFATPYPKPAYAEGYQAGHKERANRLAHKNRREGDGPHAPQLAMRGCVGEASARWSRDPRDIHVVRTRQEASNDFYVEVAAGHRHGTCEVGAGGNVFMFQNGGMQ